MYARAVLTRGLLALVVSMGTLWLATAEASAATDPFQPPPSVTGTTGTPGVGGITAPTTSPSTTTGPGGGGTNTATTLPSATAPTGGATATTGSSLPMTGSRTTGPLVLGLASIFVGWPLARAGRRRWDARRFPSC